MPARHEIEATHRRLIAEPSAVFGGIKEVSIPDEPMDLKMTRRDLAVQR